MAGVPWPAAFQVIAIGVPPLQHQSRSGGVSLSGDEQTVSTGFGRFRFSVTVQIRTRAHRKAMTAFTAAMMGRANTTDVPLAVLQDRASTTGIVDGDPVAIGATSLSIDVTTGSPLEVGDYFSRADRLYVITEITGTAGTVQTVSVRPPIRATLGDGWALAITSPTCEMRFTSDDTGQMDLDLLKMSDVTLDFVEA